MFIFHAIRYSYLETISTYVDTSDESRKKEYHERESFRSHFPSYNKLKEIFEILGLQLSLFKTNIIVIYKGISNIL